MRAGAAAIALVAVAACSPRPSALSAPEIRVTDATRGARAVDVVGLPAEDLSAIRARPLAPDEWNALLRVTVDAGADASDLPAVAGSYEIADSALRFVPDFPLDPRVAHRVVFDPTRLPRNGEGAAEPWRSRPIELTVAATASQAQPTVRVTQVFPGSVLLENQLRIYVHFSAPMSAKPARDYVRLLDEQGQVVEDAFLPLDVSLWNAERTRYTLLFDPGRVKRGILPNKEMGRPLAPGRRYTLVVGRNWPDAQGQPLVDEFRREFRVVPGVLEPIVPAAWRLDAPAAGSRDPLTVTFSRALDRALAERALFVMDAGGRTLDGSVAVDDEATRWTFTPANAWAAGGYVLAASSVLEDSAGNRIGRAFDFDPTQARQESEGSDTHAEARIRFTVR